MKANLSIKVGFHFKSFFLLRLADGEFSIAEPNHKWPESPVIARGNSGQEDRYGYGFPHHH